MSAEWLKSYRESARELVPGTPSATLNVAQSELARGLGGLLGVDLPVSAQPTGDGSVIFGTPASSALIARLKLDGPAGGLGRTGNEGYLIRTLSYEGHRVTVIAANAGIGVLYGTFHFLRLLQTHQSIEHLDVVSAPHIQRRVLDHWDNLDRTVERGYAGQSIWDWHKLPDYLDPRYTDYARACASLGINGTVPTNVNASPIGLTRPYLQKYAALADIFRPYGVRIYLTARFSAPI
jgi:alpha-glucuronidase